MADLIHSDFKLSIELVAKLATAFDSQKFGINSKHGVSVWDAYNQNLVLYRFPRLFKSPAPIFSADFVRATIRAIAGFPSLIIKLLRLRAQSRSDSGGTTRTSTKTPTVLVVAFTPVIFRDTLRPLVEHLKRDSELNMVVLRAPSASSGSALDEPNVFSITHFSKLSVIQIAKVFLLALRNFAVMGVAVVQFLFRNSTSVPNKMEFLGEMSWFLSHDIPFFHVWTEYVDAAIKALIPSLVITADDSDPKCRIVTACARTEGVRTLLVQQGLTAKEYPEWYQFSCDFAAVMGTASLDAMMSQGVGPEKVTVTGHPGFDQLLMPQIGRLAALRSKLNLHSGLPVITFFSQPYYQNTLKNPEIRVEMISDLASAFQAINDANLLVKPHPAEQGDWLRDVFFKTTARHVDNDVTANELVQISDIVITINSTCAMQALYLDKPVINLHYPDCTTGDLYIRSGATWVAQSREEIFALIREVLTHLSAPYDGERRGRLNTFLENNVFRADGKACERIKLLVRKLV